jgi:hypothetical protein
MFVAIPFIIIILSISSCLTVKFKFKQENSILITFLSTGILLYILGLFNIMKFGIYLIQILTVLGIVYLIYASYKKQFKLNEIFTLGTLLYILALLVVSALVKDTYYTAWDEFSHWGSNLKAMVAYDVLWSSNLYDGVHVVYPPLAGIIEYFICKLNGGFSEAISYFAVDTFVITLLLPMLRNLKYTLKDIAKAILAMFSVFCLIFIFGFKLTSIYIDLILAMLFAIGIYISFKNENIEDKILIPIILISLVILKDTGLVLSGIILVQLGINYVLYPIIKNKKITKEIIKKFLMLIVILIVILAIYGTWKLYCSSNGKVLDYRHDTNSIAEFNIKDFIKAVIHIRCPEGKLLDISNSFYSALNSTSLVSNYPFRSAIQILIVLDIIGIVIYSVTKEKEDKRKILVLCITMNIGFILYCLLLMATYMFAFTEQEGRGLASYERYMPTYFIAWVTVIIAIIINMKKNSLKSMLIVALVCLYGMNIGTFLWPVSKGYTTMSQEIQNEGEIILNNVELSNKVYIIYQQSNGYEFHQLRYCISPVKTNLVCEWSLGEPTYEGFIWNYDISLEEFEQKLIDEEFDYVFVARSDENLTSKYGEIFAEDVDLEDLDNKLFKVEKIDDNNVVLTSYSK